MQIMHVAYEDLTAVSSPEAIFFPRDLQLLPEPNMP